MQWKYPLKKLPQPFRPAWLKYLPQALLATQALVPLLCLCHIKQFQTKLICESVDVSHTFYSQKQTSGTTDPVCLPFEKYFFISVHAYVWVYTHPYGCPWKPGASGASELITGNVSNADRYWDYSLKLCKSCRSFQHWGPPPPYSCLSMSTAVWFLDRCMCCSHQPKSRMQNTDEFVPTEFHSSSQHWDTCQWVKRLRIREKKQSRRERWGQSWYAVNTGSQTQKTQALYIHFI